MNHRMHTMHATVTTCESNNITFGEKNVDFKGFSTFPENAICSTFEKVAFSDI